MFKSACCIQCLGFQRGVAVPQSNMILGFCITVDNPGCSINRPPILSDLQNKNLMPTSCQSSRVLARKLCSTPLSGNLGFFYQVLLPLGISYFQSLRVLYRILCTQPADKGRASENTEISWDVVKNPGLKMADFISVHMPLAFRTQSRSPT